LANFKSLCINYIEVRLLEILIDDISLAEEGGFTYFGEGNLVEPIFEG